MPYFQSTHLDGVWYNKAAHDIPNSKVHAANMGPTWGRQDPDRPHVGHVILALWDNIRMDY